MNDRDATGQALRDRMRAALDRIKAEGEEMEEVQITVKRRTAKGEAAWAEWFAAEQAYLDWRVRP